MWGIDFKTDIFLPGLSFENKSQVENKIQENIEYINRAKETIKMFVASTPNSIIPEEWKEEPIRWLNNETENHFEDIKDYIRENTLLNLYLEYLNNE